MHAATDPLPTPKNGAASPPSVLLAHVSDIHITMKPLRLNRRDLFTKRLTGWINLRYLGRARRFRMAEEVLSTAMTEVRRRRPDHFIFSGDATNLGAETEFARAASLLGVGDPEMPPALAVPGNHDYYTRKVVNARIFEQHFGPWQVGHRVDDEVYPFAQRVGHVWLIGVNSSTANRWPWDAAGRVGPAQMERLRRLLTSLAPGPRILVTHYPVSLRNGRPENRFHHLRDVRELVAVAAHGGVSLWLHGHRHGAYHVTDPRVAPFPIICVGSTTQYGLWSYNEYTIHGLQFRVLRRTFCPDTRTFRDGKSFDLELKGG